MLKQNTKLHFIGTKYKAFVEEARKKGISRNIPFNSAATLEWGDKIVCAVFKGYNWSRPIFYNGNYPTELQQMIEEFKGSGQAHLICDFQVTNLYVKDPEIMDAFQSDLQVKKRIVKIDDFTDDGKDPGKGVSRDCGSYNISSAIQITMELEEIVLKIREISKSLNKKPPSIMIGGELGKEYQQKIIENIKFNRGLRSIKDPNKPVKGEYKKKPKTEIKVVENYEQYTTKRDKMDAINKRLDGYFPPA
jgi:hypothetical protein